MQDILKEYGPAILTVVAILALIALITLLIGSDEASPVGQAFASLISDFFESAQEAAQLGGVDTSLPAAGTDTPAAAATP